MCKVGFHVLYMASLYSRLDAILYMCSLMPALDRCRKCFAKEADPEAGQIKRYGCSSSNTGGLHNLLAQLALTNGHFHAIWNTNRKKKRRYYCSQFNLGG